MRKWQFNIRKLLIWVVLIAALFGAALFILRRGFDPGDITVEMEAPPFVTVGERAKVALVVKNGSGAALRDVRATIFVPEGTSKEPSVTQRLESIESRKQRTVEFEVPIEAGARDFAIRASVRFRAGTLSATFEKTAERSVIVSAAPVRITMSFPSDISAERPFTFLLRYQSDAPATLEDVGVTLGLPATFSIESARPSSREKDGRAVWVLGQLFPGETGEVSVTGKFSAGDPSGEFVARIGILSDDERDLRVAFHEAKEFQRALREELALMLRVQEVENPGEVIVYPGEKIQMELLYENKTARPLETVLLDLGVAHRDLDQRSITSAPSFQRLASGEFRWDATVIPKFSRLLSGEQGTISFSVTLAPTVTMNSFEDANQSFPIRARLFAEGRLQAERSTKVKIGARLALRGGAFWQDSTYINTGPLPPRQGETTTFTVRAFVVGGTNGFRNTITRFVLGPGVSFAELLEPKTATLSWDAASREVVWNIGGLSAGTGLLRPPQEVVFRIDATPRPEDVGKAMVLIETALVSGEDDFTGRLLDFQGGTVTTSDLEDKGFRARDGIVQ